MAGKERKFLHEQVRDGMIDNLKRAPGELRDTIHRKIVQGAYELGAALQAFPPGENIYRGDLGLLTAQTGPAEQESQHGVHGPQEQPGAPKKEPSRATHWREQAAERDGGKTKEIAM